MDFDLEEPVADSDFEDYLERGSFSLDPTPPQSFFAKLGGKLNNQRKYVFVAAITLVICLVVISVGIALPVGIALSGDGDESSDSGNSSAVKTTAEYQIDLTPISAWDDRNKMVDLWVQAINKNSIYIQLSLAAGNQSYYTQDSFSTKQCGDSHEIRVRNFTGVKSGVTVDIKGNNANQATACALPFAPGPKYKETSQKCEHDVHDCASRDKYSRETRIFLESMEPLTCKSVYGMYPHAFPNYDSSKDNTVLPASTSTTYWWEERYIGIADQDTQYDIAWTLDMKSSTSSTPKDGEWSIRIYTVDEGHSSVWNEDVVADVTNLHHQLIVQFSKVETC